MRERGESLGPVKALGGERWRGLRARHAGQQRGLGQGGVRQPNRRVQRTRSSPSALRSPLTRYPLGNGWREHGVVACCMGVLLALILVKPSAAADQADPCAAAAFNDQMAHIARTSSALHLLNGREDPKLARLLQIELVGSIDAARRDVEANVAVSLVSVAVAGPNWLAAIAKARSYLQSHKIARIPGTTDREMRPLDGLMVIERWIVQRQAALPKP